MVKFNDFMSSTVKELKPIMNRSILVVSILILHGPAFGQGTGVFEFSNVATTPDRHIYIGEYLGPLKAEGNGYQIAIYWGPSGTTDENALIQVGGSAVFLTGAGAGQFSGGTRTIFGASQNGAIIALQARAWDISTGATWEEAAASPAGRIGKGPIFEMKTRNQLDPLDTITPRVGDAAGWVGFPIAVPEPSVWAFALLGTCALMLLRRKR